MPHRLRSHLVPVAVVLLWTIAVAGQQPAQPASPLTFAPFHESGIYELGERIGWTVHIPQGVPVPPTGFTYTIKKNNAETIKTGTLDLSSGTATLEVALDEPAMVYARVNTTDPSGRPINLGAAVAPTRLQPSAPRPKDFDAFWDGKLKALAAVPIDPTLAPMETAVPGVDLYNVTLTSFGSHVRGYLSKPKQNGKFPALVIFQYAGVYALQTRTVTDRAAEGWLALDVSSHDMPPDQATGAPQNYQAVGNTDRETSYFLNMYLRDARAIDYIASRPDWDGKTILIMGTSMGGQQSLVTAGLHPKVTGLIVNEPSGADSNGNLHGRQAGYPNWPSTDPAVMHTALYFDTVNFAPRIKAPAIVSMGFIDTIAPPVGIWIAFNQIAGPKEAIPMIESDHNNITPQKQGAYESRAKEVRDLILHGGRFEPRPPGR